jgi:hypothetical protein
MHGGHHPDDEVFDCLIVCLIDCSFVCLLKQITIVFVSCFCIVCHCFDVVFYGFSFCLNNCSIDFSSSLLF